MKHRVYIAAPLSEVARARQLGERVRESKCEVTSRWHDEVRDGATDPEQDVARYTALKNNILDLQNTSLLIALFNVGTPKASLVELGWHLSQGRPAIWICSPEGHGRNIFDCFPTVRKASSTGEALILLQGMF